MPELRPSPFDDAMETYLIVIAGADKVVKTISAVRLNRDEPRSG